MPTIHSAPDPGAAFPVAEFPRIGFLRNIVRSPLIEAGEFSYYDDPDGPERFEEKCVLYHYDFVGDRLVIGRFCALATGIQFIMNGPTTRPEASRPFRSASSPVPGAMASTLTPTGPVIVATRPSETMSGSAWRRPFCRA